VGALPLEAVAIVGALVDGFDEVEAFPAEEFSLSLTGFQQLVFEGFRSRLVFEVDLHFLRISESRTDQARSM
jgi:hypothetical protein